MSSPEGVIYAEVPWLLQVAEHIDGDPQPDDLGPLIAGVARHRGQALGRDVYGSIWLKAASLLHTLARLPSLEHSNAQFAWLAAVAFLQVNGHTLDYPPKDAAALLRNVVTGDIGPQRIALQLRQWASA